MCGEVDIDLAALGLGDDYVTGGLPGLKGVLSNPNDYCKVGLPVGTAGPCVPVDSETVFESDESALLWMRSLAGSMSSNQVLGSSLDAAAATEGVTWLLAKTKSGGLKARWRPGFGWINAEAGMSASAMANAANVAKVAGNALYVVGGAVVGFDQFQQDKAAGVDGPVLYLRAVAHGSLNAAGAWGGATAAGLGVTAFCTSTATIGCAGPIGQGIATVVAMGAGAWAGSWVADNWVWEVVNDSPPLSR
jgi:hypothetical protein